MASAEARKALAGTPSADVLKVHGPGVAADVAARLGSAGLFSTGGTVLWDDVHTVPVAELRELAKALEAVSTESSVLVALASSPVNAAAKAVWTSWGAEFVDCSWPTDPRQAEKKLRAHADTLGVHLPVELTPALRSCVGESVVAGRSVIDAAHVAGWEQVTTRQWQDLWAGTPSGDLWQVGKKALKGHAASAVAAANELSTDPVAVSTFLVNQVADTAGGSIADCERVVGALDAAVDCRRRGDAIDLAWALVVAARPAEQGR